MSLPGDHADAVPVGVDDLSTGLLMGDQIPAAPARAPDPPAAREEATAVHLDARREQ
jgi:hypothetical protein